jgi:SAM-dependent methyltransferase
MDFNQGHRVIWTRKKIADFWNHSPEMQNRHFSKQRGPSLLRVLKKIIELETPVLDLGCGSGHLLSLLLQEGIESWGADISERSIEIVNKRFNGDLNFKGIKKLIEGETLPFESNSTGTVFLIETIEHLFEENLHIILNDIQKILKKDGLLVVTTPNREKLEENEILCPNCGCKFHRVQHLRSFDSGMLRSIIENTGFEVIRCGPEILLPDLKVWFSAQKTGGSNFVCCPDCFHKIELKSKKVLFRLGKFFQELGHLVCIAKKR